MKRRGNQIFIGTSGWSYSDWRGIFYPVDLSARQKLEYYSRRFRTTEINYSFYRLPKPLIYQNWYRETPSDFVFAVKVSRFITHVKRMKEIRQPFKLFWANARQLKEKLGPLLFQFPPSFKMSVLNLKRLEVFLKWVRNQKHNIPLRMAFEFRHQGWCCEDVCGLLKKYNVAWVIADSPVYPKAEVVTADFAYVRMHGSRILFASKYTQKELEDLAIKIKRWLRRKKDVFVYFNNDFAGYAVENAQTLAKLLDIDKGQDIINQ